MKLTKTKILLIEENSAAKELFLTKISNRILPTNVHHVKTVNEALEYLTNTQSSKDRRHLVVLGLCLADTIKLHSLEKLIQCCPDLPIITITSSIDKLLPLKAFKIGATDFLQKDDHKDVILRAIQYAVRRKSVENALKKSLERATHLANKQDELIAIVSHDLRSPLKVIQQRSRLALEENSNLDDELKETLEHTVSDASYSLEMITSLLDMAALEGNISLKLDEVHINDLLLEFNSSYSEFVHNSGLTLDIVCEEDVWVHGDRNRIRQTVQNVVDNAIKHCGEGTDIKVTVSSPEASFVQILIEDNGPGIDSENFLSIFDKFFNIQLQSSSGVGLGLNICKQIVEMHHGKIWVESEVGRGTKFFIQFPRLR